MRQSETGKPVLPRLSQITCMPSVKGKQAEPLYVHALAIYEQKLGPQHPHTQVILGNYASHLHMKGRDEEVTVLNMKRTPL